MESSGELKMGSTDRMRFWLNRLFLGKGYLEVDYWWDKLTTQISQLEKEHKQVPDELIDRYSQISTRRINLGRPNEGPL